MNTDKRLANLERKVGKTGNRSETVWINSDGKTREQIEAEKAERIERTKAFHRERHGHDVDVRVRVHSVKSLLADLRNLPDVKIEEPHNATE